jgi:hypothetical protein
LPQLAAERNGTKNLVLQALQSINNPALCLIFNVPVLRYGGCVCLLDAQVFPQSMTADYSGFNNSCKAIAMLECWQSDKKKQICPSTQNGNRWNSMLSLSVAGRPVSLPPAACRNWPQQIVKKCRWSSSKKDPKLARIF